MSASHIVQAGNDFFIGRNEACIMNRKKKEKSVLIKEGNVYVLDLFVKGAIQRGSAHRAHAHGS